MPFVQFEQEYKSFRGNAKPDASILKSGHLRINKYAVEALKLHEVTHVTLHFDKDREAIGLKPCTPETRFAFKFGFQEKDGCAVVACKSLLQHHDFYPTAVGIHNAPKLEDGMIVIPLGADYAGPEDTPKKKGK